VALTFEWDPEKAEHNIAKHGIEFNEAATVFGDSLSLTIPDPDHSFGEQRYVTIGIEYSGRLLVVVHTDTKERIRIISARRASRAERNGYEKGT